MLLLAFSSLNCTEVILSPPPSYPQSITTAMNLMSRDCLLTVMFSRSWQCNVREVCRVRELLQSLWYLLLSFYYDDLSVSVQICPILDRIQAWPLRIGRIRIRPNKSHSFIIRRNIFLPKSGSKFEKTDRKCSWSRHRPQKVDKRMVLEHTHGLFIT